MALDPSDYLFEPENAETPAPDSAPDDLPDYKPPTAKPSPLRLVQPSEITPNPPPHSVGSEKTVLSLYLTTPKLRTRIGDTVTTEHFYLPAHRIMWEIATSIHAKGKTIEPSSLLQYLLDGGNLDRIGGPSTIADLWSYALTPDGLDNALELLSTKHAAREAITQARKLIQEIEESPDDVIETIGKAAVVLKSTADSSSFATPLLARAYEMAYRPDSPQPPDEVVMSLGDAPIAAQAGLTVVQGKAKAGKSAVVSSIIGAALRGKYATKGDTIDIEWTGKDPNGAVIHFDTEQSPGDWWGLATRGVIRSGINRPDIVQRLVSIPLIQFTVKERRSLLGSVLSDQNTKMGSISVVVIDGVADICRDPNDPEEAFETVRWLMELSHKYSTAIFCVLHENPSSEDGKTRGHLGSELTRKAYGNLRVDKDDDSVSVLYGPLMRKKDIPKHMGTCFAWSEDARMHVTLGSQREVIASKREEKANEAQAKRDRDDSPIIQDILETPMNFSDLTIAVMERFDVKKRAAETKISKWTGRLIVKTNEGKYVFK